MNGVNLIPAQRIRVRKASRRAHAWLLAVPCCVALLLAAYGINAVAWTTDSTDAARALEETESQIKRGSEIVSKRQKELTELRAAQVANKSVGEQPDWGRMLALMANKLGADAALTSFAVDPVREKDPKKKGGEASEVGRSRLLKISLTGVARAQEAVSGYILELERTGLFDNVKLVETKRGDGEDVRFEIVCDVSDTGAIVK